MAINEGEYGMRRWNGFRNATAVAAIFGSLLISGGAAAGPLGEEKFKPGDAAPDFTTTDLTGAKVRLSDFRGKVVLLNFWGLRCGACLEEMPYLESMHQKLRGRGLVTLGVDTDGVDIATVQATLTEVKVSVTYQLLIDQDFTITDIFTNFLVPLTIVIDRKGIIGYIHTGFEKGLEKEYEAAVVKALGS